MKNGNPTDGQLLAQFGDDEDGHQAFAEIVNRHGAMVFRICQRLCRTRHDAEDAAQNVFVTLADRASELKLRDCVAGWLHRTACYTAMRWRRAALTRQRHERLAGELRPDIDPGGAGLETREPIDQLERALGALPEDYRNALILHHLEGHSVEQVAELLATPTGTVAARLSRGRAMLRDRLAIMGLAITDLDFDDLLLTPVAFRTRRGFTKAASRSDMGQWAGSPVQSTICTGGAVSVGGGGSLGMVLKFKAAIFLVAVSSVAIGGTVSNQTLSPPPQSAVAQSESKPASGKGISWGSGGTSVPEPSGFLPLALASTMLTRRRRH